ncbi:Spondin_N [Halogranum gelatinilyticum]|uniref:Spondin_N n=1 Tax=Halogranum gelatinilyticum TaxID=660521 RepID=A0A1G9XYX0_9EURY|nr:spondin domain-containing protein [Halogranum gelatinilyticum]SDN02052.1 Spondin_N [Halogranum gelatinilyticum]
MTHDTTRRRFLIGVGAAGTVALAGCTTGGDGGSQPTTESMGGETTTESMGGEMNESMSETTSESMDDGMMATTFTVRVENVGSAETLQTSEGPVPAVLAPVAYAVHDEGVSLFTEDEAASPGLETLAEDGGPSTLVGEVEMSVDHAGAAAVPEGGDEAGPIGPGGAYTFQVEAHAGHRLSLATMFVQSNDLFYAPEPSGIPLFDENDEPVDGDRTSHLLLWDAGTEVNEEPGVGPNQAPRQSGPNTGDDEMGTVRRIGDVDDGYDYPETTSVVRLTISPSQAMDN